MSGSRNTARHGPRTRRSGACRTASPVAVAIVGVCALAGGAIAQAPGQPEGAGRGFGVEGLRRIDPGTADLSPNGASLRILPDVLRPPTGFEQLYAVPQGAPIGSRAPGTVAPGTDFSGSGERYFARADGGVVAVFPRSVYVPTQAGNIPLIPPGTVFHIGSPESILGERSGGSPSTPSTTSPWRVNTRVDLRVDRSLAGAGAREAERGLRQPRRRPGSICTDEPYRRRRVAELLDAAHRAAPARR